MRRKNNNALDAIKRRPRRWLVFFRSSVSSSSIFFIRSSSSFSPFFKSLSPRTTLPPCGLLTSPVGFHWKTFSFEYGVWFGSIRFSLWFLSDSPGYRFQWNFSIARFTWHSTTDGVLPSFAKLYWVERGFSCFFLLDTAGFYCVPQQSCRTSLTTLPWCGLFASAVPHCGRRKEKWSHSSSSQVREGGRERSTSRNLVCRNLQNETKKAKQNKTELNSPRWRHRSWTRQSSTALPWPYFFFHFALDMQRWLAEKCNGNNRKKI